MNSCAGSFAMFLLAGLCLILPACSNDMAEINAVVTQRQAQQDRAEEVTILYSKNAKVTARLSAHLFVRNETANPSYVDMSGGLKVEFFGPEMQVRNTLTARRGRWYDVQNNVLLRDSVYIVNDRGEQMLTDELVWNEKLQRFYTDKPVRIIMPTRVIYGQGLEANQDFSWYRISRPTGNVKVDKSAVPQ